MSQIQLGPDWQTIAVFCVGVIITLVGAYAKSISIRVGKLEDKFNELEIMVLRDYHNKDEINEILRELRQSIRALHERFDRAGFPIATRNNDGYGDKG